MDSEQIIRKKAEAFDSIVRLFYELESAAGFGSSNWVILAEALEEELKKIQQAQGE